MITIFYKYFEEECTKLVLCYLLVLNCLRLASIARSWSGVSYARTISPSLLTEVAPVGVWKRKWVLFCSFSLSLWDLLCDFSITSLDSLRFDFKTWFWHWNCSDESACLFELGSLDALCKSFFFFFLPFNFFLGPNISSFSTRLGNWGDTCE